jgi:hypothetical protein
MNPSQVKRRLYRYHLIYHITPVYYYYNHQSRIDHRRQARVPILK